MSEEQSHASFMQECTNTRKEAEQYLTFRPALSPDNPKARFPGFRQNVTLFKKGQQVKPGARPLPVDIVMHESVPMVLSDGVKIYCDIFLPATLPRDLNQQVEESDQVPALVAWSPYGKQMGTTLLDDFPFRAGVPKEWLSGLEKWEGPDPAFWCAEGYAVINVDTRGAFTSEGKLLIFGHQEAQDGAEFVTWVSERAWCNGKVALTGNSWLAIAQWKIGSLRPRGLAALAPWEGLQDTYRDSHCQGGIPSANFHESVVEPFASYSELEDLTAVLKKTDGLWNSYWEDKKSNPDQINVPTYVVGSWTNPVHTPGTLRAFRMIPDSTPKWLRVHNSQEWPDYYADSSCRDLKRFFDYYLKGDTDNGWPSTPRIRLSVLNFGLSGLDDTMNRAETEWPLARTRYEKLYLSPTGEMGPFTPQQTPSMTKYNSKNGKVTFRYTIPSEMETTGYFLARLVVSCPSYSDMDLFVQVCCLDEKSLYRQGVMTIRPDNMVVRALLKLLHDWHFGLSKVGMLFHWGPAGQVRVSHASQKAKSSTPFEPLYEHKEEIPLAKGEKRVVEIPLRPYGMFWKKGTVMELTVSGNPVIPFPIPGVEPLYGRNEGEHVIHCFDRGEDSSCLVVPRV
ncbi:Alpha/Beta hydrolase protein [Aspergillus unguis]